MKEIIDFTRDPDNVEGRRDVYLQLPKHERIQFLELLKAIKSEAAGRLLTAILPGEADKELQKMIRKQVFRLKTMGIQVEEQPLGGEPVLRKIEEKRVHRGFMSNYDAKGTRIVIDVFEVKRNNFVIVHAITHLSDGLMELRLATVTRLDLNAIISEYERAVTPSIVFVEISPRYAACLIEEADSRSHRYTEDVARLKQFAVTLKEEIGRPEDIYDLPVPGGVEALPMDAVLSHSIFEPLTLMWDTRETDRKTFADLGAPAIVLPPHMTAEKKETFLKALLESEPINSKVPFITRMLEDYAYIFFNTAQFSHFKGLINLLKSERGKIDVLAFFARKSLEPEKTERQPGLIVNPYE